MNRRGLVVLVIALIVGVLVGAAPSALAQPQRASIAGQVVRFPGGDPVAGATVRLLDRPAGQGVLARDAEPRTVTTTEDGSFLLTGVEPGNHWLAAALQGYLPSEYGQRTATGRGMPLRVTTAQRVTGVRLVLWPTASMSGRIVDADGDPLGRVQVQALKVIYPEGRPAMTIEQAVLTNDRGEYRFFWLAPGQYRVAAKQWDSSSRSSPVYIAPPRRFGTLELATAPVVDSRSLENGQVVEETYLPVYFPGTTDAQAASIVDLSPGANAAGTDIQLAGNRVPVYHIRGSIWVGGQRPFPTQVVAVPRTPSPSMTIPAATSRPDGSFDIAGVAAGSYIVSESTDATLVAVEVAGGDVEGVTLAKTSVDIPGRLLVERNGSSGAAPGLITMPITLTRDPDLLGLPSPGPSFNPPPAADGSFRLNDIGPGDYRVIVRPLNGPASGPQDGSPTPQSLQNAYVKSIRWGGADVLAHGLHVAGQVPGALEIIVSLNGAEVDGTVLDHAGMPAANMTVVVVPDADHRGRTDLYKTDSTDTSGRFRLRAMPPGDYTVLAFDDVEAGAWQNAEFIRAYENRGRFIHVREGANEPLELNLITR